MNNCECSNPVLGVAWPMASGGDDSAPFVERCDDCKIFDDDVQAAEAIVKAGYGIVVFVPVHNSSHHILAGVRQPAVYPWPKGFKRGYAS